MSRARARSKSKSRARSKSGATTGARIETSAVGGELRQLASLRARFAALDDAVAATLLAQHDEADCRERGTATRAGRTFTGAMSWARTFGAHADDPAVARVAIRVRWFLDCLGVLGAALAGKATHANPAHESALRDAEASAQRLLRRATRLARECAGSSRAHNDAVSAALAPEGPGDATIARLRSLATLLDAWCTTDAAVTIPLVAYGIDARTVEALQAAAQALEDAIANRPAPRQPDRDTPAINVAEGRLLLVMRGLWNDLAEAREDGLTSLQVPVSPTILRGLDLHARKAKPTAPDEPPTPA